MELPLLCWFLDAGNDETLRTLNWPASKKRQGTKPRDVGDWLAVSSVDLMLAPDLDYGQDASTTRPACMVAREVGRVR
jgi:hypothetical protein